MGNKPCSKEKEMQTSKYFNEVLWHNEDWLWWGKDVNENDNKNYLPYAKDFENSTVQRI